MAIAWFFDSGNVHSIEFLPDDIPINFLLIPPAHAETIHPNQYPYVKNILGARTTLNVSPYTVKKTKTHTYKVWAKDMETKSGKGYQFYNTDVVFYDKLLLVKYETITLPEMDISISLDYMENPNKPLFYEPAKVVDCEYPKFQYKEGNQEGGWMFNIENNSLVVKDLLHTCANCGKCCGNSKCGKCKKVYYCNAECQHKHWNNHKSNCKAS